MSGSSYTTETVTQDELYRLCRGRIEHEDDLIVQRLSWLVAAQSFLFTAYAITTNALTTLDPKAAGSFLDHAVLVFRLIPTVAICTALLIYISILAALQAIRQVRRFYLSKPIPNDLPPIQTSATTRLLGLSAPLLLPLLFVSVWLVLLINGPTRR